MKPLMKSLGAWLKEQREQHGMSLRGTARALGVSAPYWSDVEHNNRYPSDRHLGAVARLLGLEPGDVAANDTRPPIREFRRRAMRDPGFALACRRLLESSVTTQQLLDWLRERDGQERRGEMP